MDERRVRFWLQYLGAYILAVFAAATFGYAISVRLDLFSGALAGYFLGFPLGCAAGLYIGSKVLLRNKGLHPVAVGASFCLAFCGQFAILVAAALCGALLFMLEAHKASWLSEINWLWIAGGCLVLAEAVAVRLTAAAFNSLIDFAVSPKAKRSLAVQADND